MGFSGSSGGGGIVLPIHVPAGGALADSLANGAMTIGGGAGTTNLILAATNLVGIGQADTFLSRQGAGVLLTSRLMAQAADEAAGATAGAGAALPATVQGYRLITDSGGVARKVPYYAV